MPKRTQEPDSDGFVPASKKAKTGKDLEGLDNSERGLRGSGNGNGNGEKGDAMDLDVNVSETATPNTSTSTATLMTTAASIATSVVVEDAKESWTKVEKRKMKKEKKVEARNEVGLSSLSLSLCFRFVDSFFSLAGWLGWALLFAPSGSFEPEPPLSSCARVGRHVVALGASWMETSGR